MTFEHTEGWVVRSKHAPTVEIGTEAAAAYVRFKQAQVAKTVRHASKWPIITIDLDARGEVVGVEFVGLKRFDVDHLLIQAGFDAPAEVVAHASYRSAESELE